MSPAAQRIALAAACGKSTTAFRFWRKGHNDTEWHESPSYPFESSAEYWREKESHWGETKPVESIVSHENTPNYTGDLNAIHDAILALIVRGPDIVPCCSNEGLFDAELDSICEREEIPVWHFGADLYCEALLRTLGLYKDTP